jgi:hypothetical protein
MDSSNSSAQPAASLVQGAKEGNAEMSLEQKMESEAAQPVDKQSEEEVASPSDATASVEVSQKELEAEQVQTSRRETVLVESLPAAPVAPDSDSSAEVAPSQQDPPVDEEKQQASNSGEDTKSSEGGLQGTNPGLTVDTTEAAAAVEPAKEEPLVSTEPAAEEVSSAGTESQGPPVDAAAAASLSVANDDMPRESMVPDILPVAPTPAPP